MRLDFFSPLSIRRLSTLLHNRFPEEKRAGREKRLGLSTQGALMDRRMNGWRVQERKERERGEGMSGQGMSA